MSTRLALSSTLRNEPLGSDSNESDDEGFMPLKPLCRGCNPPLHISIPTRALSISSYPPRIACDCPRAPEAFLFSSRLPAAAQNLAAQAGTSARPPESNIAARHRARILRPHPFHPLEADVPA